MSDKTPQIRAAKQARLPVMIFVSVFGHALAMILFLIFPGLISTGDPEPFGGGSGPGGNVTWVSMSASGREGKQSEKELTQEEPAPAARIKKLTEPEEEIPLPSKTEFPEEVKTKPKDEPTAKESLNIPLNKRKEKGTEFGRGTDRRETAGESGTGGRGKTGVGIGIGGPGDGGSGTGTGVPFPYPWYVDIVKTKIELAWRKPFLNQSTPQEYLTTVYFVIQRNGQVRSIKVEENSGILPLDRSCESAVSGAAPFPPLPNQWTEPELAFRLTFRYTP
jgi:periplasmic protein TonB